MELLELMKHRRSIRKYQDRQISKADLETIIEAGTYAPNAGGGQRSMIVGIYNAVLAGKIGKMNVARFDRSELSGSYVSQEQPSIIDDPSIKSGFYGAPTVCIVARGEETFDSKMGTALLQEWDIPENYIARCFVLLGYADSEYPSGKLRKAGRSKIVE